ncbi:modifier of snc1 [Tasmannia lanceolata]|uniref:modifier of snc1 n=1 Tax=Tasmannia lanceolata TaxID=3420 RepID=UPI0040642CD5
MASSMLTGERRWVSARRGSMTVLGKVSVPKPVNLPSQRLENHGLDPNVEIVPKGTLSWGSHSSSSAPNAWGSPALSPATTAGSVGSPKHLNGRPSSGGSGTRPSTAGSDRSYEPNAWGPNSRPSSASGVLASNQTSMASSRPRSAETRPGSSQLSRFAEPIAENSVAWGRPGTAEKLGSASSKINSFNLSSGDFPTLGSEKNSDQHVRQGHSSQGRPVSASGGAETEKERLEISPTDDVSIDASKEKGTVNTWKSDSPSYPRGGPPPSMENWQRDPQQPHPYPNANMAPHHFDPWHGTPIRNSPEGVWYRGGPPPGPYGPAGPPGTYPMEPFGYYHSQAPLPARPVPTPHSGPRPGAGPGGYYPKNGDTYPPHMPDSYVVPSHPVMPVRGVYPGPVPYDGYYGPPRMNFCNPNERDAPVVRMPAGPRAYNRYPNQNFHPDSGSFHVRPGGYAPSSAMAKDQMEYGHARDTHRGPYKVILKQHDSWGDNGAEENRGHSAMTGGPHVERLNTPETTVWENDGEADGRNDEPVNFSKPTFGEETTSQTKAADDSLVKKPGTAPNPAEGPQQFPAMKKNATLINKIEGLNTKARISDGRYEMGPVSTKEENTKQFRIVNVKADHSSNELDSSVDNTEKASTELTASVTVGPKPLELQANAALDSSGVGETAHSHAHKRGHGMQGRTDYRGKGRFNIQESEEWRKKSPGADLSVIGNVTNAEASQEAPEEQELNLPGKAGEEPYVASSLDTSDYKAQRGKMKEIATQRVKQLQREEEERTREQKAKAPEKQELNLPGKAGEEPYVASSLDTSDYKAQRAKMKEIAMQRVKQLQKEEEERTREQKAKALAKLEELNRRTLVENSTHKLENKQEGFQAYAGPKTNTGICEEAPGFALGSKSDTPIENTQNRVGESTDLSANKPSEASSCTPQDPIIAIDSSVPSPQDGNTAEIVSQRVAPQLHDSGVSKHKQMGHKRKQNISHEKNLGDKVTMGGGTKVHDNVIANANTLSEPILASANDTNAIDDSSLQHKKKNSRSIKNKHKPDEALLGTDLISSLPTDGHQVNISSESGKLKSSEPVLETSSVHTQENVEGKDFKVEVVSSDQGWSQPSEEAHGRVNDQGKPQLPRKMSRSTQAIRPAEKFHGSEAVIWAPVRPPSKTESLVETGPITVVEGNNSLVKNGHGTSNNLRTKRAEMERYVPKQVAKELSQQDSQQVSSPSLPQSISDMTIKAQYGSQGAAKSSGPDTTDAGKGGFAIETKNGEAKHSKYGKTHASWRQRGSTESSMVLQGPHDGPSSSIASKNIQNPVDELQPSKSDIFSPKGPAKSSDGWNTDNLVSTEGVTVPVELKDHGISGRGKRKQSKVHKATGHYHNPGDHKHLDSGVADKTDAQLSSFESKESDGRNISKTENQGFGEHASSHWQPKSQTYSAHNRHVSRGNGGQRVMDQPRTPEKEFPSQGTESVPMQKDKDNIAQVQPRSHQHESQKSRGNGGQRVTDQPRTPEREFPSHGTESVPPRKDIDNIAQVQPRSHQPESQKTNAAKLPNAHHHENKKERKALDVPNEVSNVPNQGPPSFSELAPENAEDEHTITSGIRRLVPQNARFNRGQEVPYGGGQGLGQETNRQQPHATGDRRKHNSHYEYQPIGSYQKPNDSFRPNSPRNETRDSSRGMGSRYRERGHNQSRRGGHFYGRNDGGPDVRVAAAYGNGE